MGYRAPEGIGTRLPNFSDPDLADPAEAYHGACHSTDTWPATRNTQA